MLSSMLVLGLGMGALQVGCSASLDDEGASASDSILDGDEDRNEHFEHDRNNGISKYDDQSCILAR